MTTSKYITFLITNKKTFILNYFYMNTYLLDRYILTSFLKKLTNILLVFVSIFLVVDIIEDIDKIIDYF